MRILRSASYVVFALLLACFSRGQAASIIPAEYGDIFSLPSGVSETYFINQTTDVRMTEQDGLFLLQEDMASRDVQAVIAVYTVLRATGAEGALQLQVDAYPVDPDSKQFIFTSPWTATYDVDENGAIQSENDHIATHWFMSAGNANSIDNVVSSTDNASLLHEMDIRGEGFIQDVDVKSNTKQFLGWDESPNTELIARVKESIVKEGRHTEDNVIQLHWTQSRENEQGFIEGQYPWSAHVIDEMQVTVTVRDSAFDGLPGSFRTVIRQETQVERVDAAFDYTIPRIEKGHVVEGTLTKRGFISSEGEPIDVYEMQGLAQERIRIRVDRDVKRVMLFDETRQIVAEESSPSDNFFVLEYDIPETGTYFIAVNQGGHEASDGHNATYALAVESLGIYVDKAVLRAELDETFATLDQILAEKTWQEAIAAFEEALYTTRTMVPLAIQNVQLVTSRPVAFGEYTVRGNNVYAAGDIVHIYVEPANIHSEYAEERYEMKLSADAVLQDEQGRAVASYPDVVVVNKRTFSRLRDVHLGLALWLGDTPKGHYEWHITVRDALSGQEARHIVPIVVE